MDKQDMGHIDYLADVVNRDLKIILEKEAMYKGSWKARGGIGAFFITARKWDALENMLSRIKYDIFDGAMGNDGDGSVIEQIRDLRRYLTLIEAEVKRLKAPIDKTPIEMSLKDVGAYGTGEINTEEANDRQDSRPKTV